MFTGLIEEQGRIKSINLTSKGMELCIECYKILEDITLGASICIDGACQSVTDFQEHSITVQTSNETLSVTTYKNLKKGDFVNLERALTLNKRLDGHIVSGHVDCIAEFIKNIDDGFSKRYFFKMPDEFMKYVVYKGAIAINGVSLTVASIEKNIFSVELIPATLKKVNLSNLKKGDFVNIETDLFAKYVENIVKSESENRINYSFLSENGFV